MPTAAPHPCPAPRCPRLVKAGQRACDEHEKAAGAADRDRRGSAAARGYGSAWQSYRLRFLSKFPLCVLCAESGPPGGDGTAKVVPATVVDHLRAHKGDQVLFWDPTNHRGVCKPHHDARTDEGDFGRKPTQEARNG